MALDRFKAPPLPRAPQEWDARYMNQLVSALERYFSALDSRAPNSAERYTADLFAGGIVAVKRLTSAEKAALAPEAGWVVFDTTLGKLCVYNGSAWETITSL